MLVKKCISNLTYGSKNEDINENIYIKNENNKHTYSAHTTTPNNIAMHYKCTDVHSMIDPCLQMV